MNAFSASAYGKSIVVIGCAVLLSFAFIGCDDGNTPPPGDAVKTKLLGQWEAEFSTPPNGLFDMNLASRAGFENTRFFHSGKGQIVFDENAMTMTRDNESVSFGYDVVIAPTHADMTTEPWSVSPGVPPFSPSRVEGGRLQAEPTATAPVLLTNAGLFSVAFSGNGEAVLTEYLGAVIHDGNGKPLMNTSGMGRTVTLTRVR